MLEGTVTVFFDGEIDARNEEVGAEAGCLARARYGTIAQHLLIHQCCPMTARCYLHTPSNRATDRKVEVHYVRTA